MLTNIVNGANFLIMEDQSDYSPQHRPYIYVAVGLDGLYKIGRSANPNQRIKNLYANQERMKLIAVYECSWGNQKAVEKAIHVMFCRQHVQSEIFKLSNDDLKLLEDMVSNGYFGLKKIQLDKVENRLVWAVDDREYIIQRLKEDQGGQSLRSYAETTGCSASYMSKIYNNQREPGPKILEHLGIERTATKEITYKPKKRWR